MAKGAARAKHDGRAHVAIGMGSAMTYRDKRRYPVGTELVEGGVHTRVWAPKRERVSLVWEERPLDGPEPQRLGPPRNPRVVPLEPEGDGYFSGFTRDVSAGQLYRFQLDDDEHPYPDPASRFQPLGPHGPSQVVDPRRYRFRASGWKGLNKPPVVYELHIGTFTREGTYRAAMGELPRLADLGITVLELLPVADFSGRFGWGYDGVNLWAPTRLYGEPDDLRAFVDAAHEHGLAVILDVVYNHLGPDGNYMPCFASEYFTKRYEGEWGDCINFDGEGSGPVREFYRANAAYWIAELRFDGLRLDATQSIHDASERHVLKDIVLGARRAAPDRTLYIVAENEPQHGRLARPEEQGGYGMDALWNDDFHHAALVALTGRREAYYTDYTGAPQELLSAAKWGFLYQGQRYAWQRKPRGAPSLDLPAQAFVTFLENHDQVANSARGARLHERTSPAKLRAMTAFFLLIPATPMLFQGQEYGAPQPFLYFADHAPELARLVARGRAEFLAQFPSLASEGAQRRFAPPHERSTFERCKLDSRDAERPLGQELLVLHKDLLRWRREDPTLARASKSELHGAVLGPSLLALRYVTTKTGGSADRLLLLNLGADARLDVLPEPLLAPPEGARWSQLFSTEEPRYGGHGLAPTWNETSWNVPAESLVMFHPVPDDSGA